MAKLVNNIDFNKNQALNLKLQHIAGSTTPDANKASDGMVYYNSTNNNVEVVSDGQVKTLAYVGQTTGGDTGQTTGGLKKFTQKVGDGTTTTFTLQHGLQGSDLLVGVREVATGEVVLSDVKIKNDTEVEVSFALAPTTEQYVVTIIG